MNGKVKEHYSRDDHYGRTLPTTAACMGTNAGLHLTSVRYYIISGNILMTGKSFKRSFSS